MQPIERTQDGLLKRGVLTLGAGLAAGAWELLALQVPGSALYIGVLPGPIGALREVSILLGLLTLAAGGLVPRAYGAAAARRAQVASLLITAGVILALGAQAYGAANGMHGVQASDLRADARAVFFIRHGGLLLFALGWLDMGLRIVRRPAAT